MFLWLSELARSEARALTWSLKIGALPAASLRKVGPFPSAWPGIGGRLLPLIPHWW